MGRQGDGFAARLDALDEVARTRLPSIANALRASIGLVTDHSRTERPTAVPAVSLMEREYGTFTQEIGNRQRTGCDLVDATAAALHDIVAVYRRADGQG